MDSIARYIRPEIQAHLNIRHLCRASLHRWRARIPIGPRSTNFSRFETSNYDVVFYRAPLILLRWKRQALASITLRNQIRISKRQFDEANRCKLRRCLTLFKRRQCVNEDFIERQLEAIWQMRKFRAAKVLVGWSRSVTALNVWKRRNYLAPRAWRNITAPIFDTWLKEIAPAALRARALRELAIGWNSASLRFRALDLWRRYRLNRNARLLESRAHHEIHVRTALILAVSRWIRVKNLRISPLRSRAKLLLRLLRIKVAHLRASELLQVWACRWLALVVLQSWRHFITPAAKYDRLLANRRWNHHDNVKTHFKKSRSSRSHASYVNAQKLQPPSTHTPRTNEHVQMASKKKSTPQHQLKASTHSILSKGNFVREKPRPKGHRYESILVQVERERAQEAVKRRVLSRLAPSPSFDLYV